MSNTWDKLTAEERDAQVARALGWKQQEVNGQLLWFDASGTVSLWGGLALGVLPPFSTYPPACREVENSIERRELQEEYAEKLAAIVDPDGAAVYPSTIEIDQYTSPHRTAGLWIWAISRATPDQRCLAALKTLGVAPTVEPIIASEGWIRVLE